MLTICFSESESGPHGRHQAVMYILTSVNVLNCHAALQPEEFPKHCVISDPKWYCELGCENLPILEPSIKNKESIIMKSEERRDIVKRGSEKYTHSNLK